MDRQQAVRLRAEHLPQWLLLASGTMAVLSRSRHWVYRFVVVGFDPAAMLLAVDVLRFSLWTYYCVNFVHDRTLSSINSMPRADKSNLSFDIATLCRRNINLASG